jgi:hypothetical protein
MADARRSFRLSLSAKDRPSKREIICSVVDILLKRLKGLRRLKGIKRLLLLVGGLFIGGFGHFNFYLWLKIVL